MSSKRVGDDVYIVGGGPSLKGRSFISLCSRDTICVNMSVFSIPEPTYFITTDYTFLRKIPTLVETLDAIDTTKVFVVAMHHDFLREKDGAFVDTRFNLVYDLSLFDIIIKAFNVSGIGHTWKDFCTGLNSGFCAIQLAVLLGYKRIFLLGMDFSIQGGTHYHNQYGVRAGRFANDLKTYAHYFAEGLRCIQTETSIQVINCSPISPFRKQMPYVAYEEFLQ